MPLEISSLRELSAEKIAQMVAVFAQLMQERHPEVELKRGVFHDLVLYFNGVLNTAVRENIDRVLQSRSLKQIVENPTLAETELVDHVLSNFNILRGGGTAATGVVTFTFLSPVPTTISSAATYTANDTESTFRATNDFDVFPPDAAASVLDTATERVMIAVGDGTYTANIPFIALNPGAEGNIKRGTKLRADIIPGNVADAFAASDFVGGRGPRTNEEYLNILALGLTAKTISSRRSYEAAIRSRAAFQNMLHCSVMGLGDAEQQRDQHSLFPISGGGKIDVYVQMQTGAQQSDAVLEATYVGIGENGTIWQIPIGRDVAPGLYDVVRVAAAEDLTTNGYQVISDTRGVDLTDISYAPDIAYVFEGVYSRYQTALIQFEDSDTLSSGLTVNQSKKLYRVTTRSMPYVADIHDFLTSRENRPRATDLLVKAPIPCFTKIAFQIRKDVNDIISEETIANMKRDIIAAVGRVGFSGQLHASIITTAAHRYLVGRQAIADVDLFARVRRPDGSIFYLRDPSILVIPDDPVRLVTGRTTAFLVTEDDITISYTTAGFTV